jgi:hypothetical protein
MTSIKTSSAYDLLNARRSRLEWHLQATKKQKRPKDHSFHLAFSRTNDEQKGGPWTPKSAPNMIPYQSGEVTRTTNRLVQRRNAIMGSALRTGEAL